MRIKPYLLIWTALVTATIANAQTLDQRIESGLDTFNVNNPQEKIFLHSDRSSYIAGETIWFKLYNTIDGKPTFISKVVYVELVNSSNEVVEKRMLPSKDGFAHGDIFLKETLPPGNYSLNAYSLWMLNYPELIFRKSVYVFNTDRQKDPQPKPSSAFKVQFLPEGGDLIAGVNSRIAFKAVSSNGLPLNVRGEVVDNSNIKVADIVTIHDGMGRFELLPKAGVKYKAIFVTEDGKKTSFDLPAAKSEGVALQVNNENPNRLFVVASRGETNSAKYNKLMLVAQMQGELLYVAPLNFEAGESAAAIPKKDLPSGIMQVTLWSEDGLPLAERLVFISNYNLPDTRLITDTVSTGRRARNYYTLDLSAFKDVSVSASVVNLTADSILYEDNLFTNLLLTSDLKGYVHEPAFYFKDKSPATIQALDLLMMTNGWRRFNIKDIANKKFPSLRFPVESGISIFGTLTKASGKTLETGRMDFITRTEDSLTILSTVKLNGTEFVIPDLDFRKGASIYYQGTNTKNESALTSVKINPAYFDTLKKSAYTPWIDMNPSNANSPLAFGSYTERLLEEKRSIDKTFGITMDTIVVKAKRLSVTDSLNRVYASDLFYNSDQTIPMDKFNYISIWQFLQRNVPGLDVGRDQYGQTTVFFSRFTGLDAIPSTDVGDETPIDNTTNIEFFLNEVPVPKAVIDALHPTDVGMVKVFKGPSATVLGASRGAISVYTVKGKSTKDWRDRGFESFRKEGYAVSREFYHMDYKLLDPNSSFSDVRPTIYWNSNVPVNKDGKAVIRFYNDDVAKKLKIRVMGMDKDGKVVNIDVIIE